MIEFCYRIMNKYEKYKKGSLYSIRRNAYKNKKKGKCNISIYIRDLEIKEYIYIRRRAAHIAQLGERQTEDLKVMCSIHIEGIGK